MIIVGNTLVSEDIVEVAFACNLEMCKGECCIQGDAGAPLGIEELPAIAARIDAIAAELPELNRALLSERGFYEIDTDGEPVTTCMPDGACVFSIKNALGILMCGMEEAYKKGTSDFIKPISCHLYPIRISEIGEYTALNYHSWNICAPACEHGRQMGVKVYEFVGPALKRRFGEEWYREMEMIARAHLGLTE